MGRIVAAIGAIAMLAAAWAQAGSAASVPFPDHVVTASFEVIRAGSPGPSPVPASVRTGFTSLVPGDPATPSLSSIAIEFTDTVGIDPSGLPPCRFKELFDDYERGRPPCSGSLVGRGRVVSEIQLPGQLPIEEVGTLRAFYGVAEGQPRIFAQVRGNPLTYVIPFELKNVQGPYRTRLLVPAMRAIRGKCTRGHPDCFAQPYSLKGYYSRISSFEMTLHRVFAHEGGRASFVSTSCAGGGKSSSRRPLERLRLRFAHRDEVEGIVSGRCAAIAS
jgi:hypothetical protein